MTTEKSKAVEKEAEKTPGTKGNGWTYIPDADIYENDKEYVVMLSMPGVSDKSVDVLVEDNVLTIKGESVGDPTEGYRLVRAEHGAGRYERAFALSDDLDYPKIVARMKNGVLRIALPRKEKAKPQRVAIAVE